MDVTNNDVPTTTTPFGKEMRDQHFLFDSSYINLNHERLTSFELEGAYGGYPRLVKEKLHFLQSEAEATPDAFIRYIFPRRLNETRCLLANQLNVATDEIVLVPNATTAINTVLRNLVFRPGDKIVYFSTIYGAIERTLQYIIESTPVETIEVKYVMPISDDDLVARLRETLMKYNAEKEVRVVIFDTIASMPGFRMPFERLTKLCHEEGVLSLIDGAHGVGHIPLDLGALQPDFFVTNCHKWLFVPRACAIFYVPFRNQHILRSTLPTSHGFVPRVSKGTVHNPIIKTEAGTSNSFVAQFEYTGTIDNAPPLCIPAALAFRNNICGGESNIRSYCTKLAEQGEKLVVSILGTEALALESGSRVNFANIRLPLLVAESAYKGHESSECTLIPQEHVVQVTNFLNSKFIDEYHTYIAIIFYNGAWWSRFSAQIYLDLDDFIYGAQVLKKLCARIQAGEYLDHA